MNSWRPEGITIQELLDNFNSRLLLEVVAGRKGLTRVVSSSDIHRPSLVLTGFVDLFAFDGIQLLGNTEHLYLSSLDEVTRRQALDTLYQFELPCLVVTNALTPQPPLPELADKSGIPLLRTDLSTARFVHLLIACLDEAFAQRTQNHGSLVDVYGVGLLFTGKSGIGKSEIALDLVERGHRLVADDLVTITRWAEGILIGSADKTLGHYMEIRGLGIIAVQELFGIRAIRQHKRVEVEVHLQEWNDAKGYDRLGLDKKMTSILGVDIPCVTVPIYPGKNITVIAEVIAMNHLLKLNGIDSADKFFNQHQQIMGQQAEVERSPEPQ